MRPTIQPPMTVNWGLPSSSDFADDDGVLLSPVPSMLDRGRRHSLSTVSSRSSRSSRSRSHTPPPATTIIIPAQPAKPLPVAPSANAPLVVPSHPSTPLKDETQSNNKPDSQPTPTTLPTVIQPPTIWPGSTLKRDRRNRFSCGTAPYIPPVSPIMPPSPVDSYAGGVPWYDTPYYCPPPVPAPPIPMPMNAPFQCDSWGTPISQMPTKFYFADGNIVIQFRDASRVKVHKHFLESNSTALTSRIQGLTMSAMNNRRLGHISNPNPLPEANPLYLFDVDRPEFEHLLSIFYPTDYLHYDPKTVQDWTSVLSMAAKFDMPKIRALAMDRLSELAGPADRIALANRFAIKEWLAPAYTELCTRHEPLSEEESKKIGLEAVVKITAMKRVVEENLKALINVEKLTEMFEDQLGFKKTDKSSKRRA